MAHEHPFHLFEVFGVELEYMIVDRDTLAVRPICDVLLQDASRLPGASVEDEDDDDADPNFPSEVALPCGVSFSNELTAHVLELKVSEPAKSLAGLHEKFASAIQIANSLLATRNAMLLPTGMHPTMDPARDMVLWKHGYRTFYETFHRIFDCRGHGWANLQAVHLNLPFSLQHERDDEHSEFARLHAAVRAMLPLCPAIAASSPWKDGEATGLLDNRLEAYRTNSRTVPSTAGRVIPEQVFTHADYDRVIFQTIYRELVPHDPEGTLRHEWANARGAIARFSRGSIEVRVLDVQESPRMDLGVCAIVADVARLLTDAPRAQQNALRELTIDQLHAILLATIADADYTMIEDRAFLRALGLPDVPVRAIDAWAKLLERCPANTPSRTTHASEVGILLSKGCLARRMLHSGKHASSSANAHMRAVMQRLSRCVQANDAYLPA